MKQTGLKRKAPLKPGGPLKRTKIKRKKRKYTKHRRSPDREKWTNGDWKKECDTLWSKIIRTKAMQEAHDQDVPYCAVCRTLPPEQRINATKWDAHHLITRGQDFYRHMIINGILLDSYHHENSPYFSARHTPHAFNHWLEKHHPDQHAWYAKNRNEIHRSLTINYREVHSVLEAKLKEIE